MSIGRGLERRVHGQRAPTPRSPAMSTPHRQRPAHGPNPIALFQGQVSGTPSASTPRLDGIWSLRPKHAHHADRPSQELLRLVIRNLCGARVLDAVVLRTKGSHVIRDSLSHSWFTLQKAFESCGFFRPGNVPSNEVAIDRTIDPA